MMPKKRKAPETFNEWVGKVIENAMNSKGWRQEDLAREAGLPPTNVGRSIRGTRPLSVREFEILAGTLGVAADKLLNNALDEYGGMEKLLADHAAVSEGERTVDDNVTYLGRVTPELSNAAEDKGRAPSRD